MADKTEFFSEGYRFASLEDAQQAQLEKKKAAYFESKMANRNVQNMLSVYDKILDEKVFQTPAGWEYLKKLQKELRLLGIEEEKIRPIPMYVTFMHDQNEENVLRTRIRTPEKRKKEKRNLRISILVNIFLGILVTAMFVVTLKSDNPNILNYRSVIENKYASWEQELTQREQILRQKEAQLEKDEDTASDTDGKGAYKKR